MFKAGIDRAGHHKHRGVKCDPDLEIIVPGHHCDTSELFELEHGTDAQRYFFAGKELLYPDSELQGSDTGALYGSSQE